jgi:hypothetical protein
MFFKHSSKLMCCLIAAGIMLLSPFTHAISTENVDLQARAEIADLKARLAALERLLARQVNPGQEEKTPVEHVAITSAATKASGGSLQDTGYVSIDQVEGQNKSAEGVSANPWYKNIELSGFVGTGFIDSGNAGTRGDGGFLVKESALFLEADIWGNDSFFLEIQANRLGDDKSKYIRTGEVYIHLRDLVDGWQNSRIGAKIGRIDIPFGEEYLYQDAIDNPLISTSAAYAYGWDEGVLLYGETSGIGWAAAITDGTDQRSIEDNPSKAFNGKIWGNPTEALYLSASIMSNGKAEKSALEFGGSHFQPVGASHQSSLGSSSSDQVDSLSFEVDAKFRFGEFLDNGHLALAYGWAELDDDDSVYDRDLEWLIIEPVYYLRENLYIAARYSEIGTTDSNEGYHFDGKTTAGGNSAFGYDTENFRRISVGVGWWINPHMNLKVEYTKDKFDLIDSSTLDADNGNRDLYGVELTAKF